MSCKLKTEDKLFDTVPRKEFEANLQDIAEWVDGNFHGTLALDPDDPVEVDEAMRLSDRLTERTLAMGGTISGEHGVGIEKRDLMTVQYNPTDLAQQLRIKEVFDPDWLLNPGKVFPLETRVEQ